MSLNIHCGTRRNEVIMLAAIFGVTIEQFEEEERAKALALAAEKHGVSVDVYKSMAEERRREDLAERLMLMQECEERDMYFEHGYASLLSYEAYLRAEEEEAQFQSVRAEAKKAQKARNLANRKRRGDECRDRCKR